ncbi:ribonuclease M5 [Fodinisporobacter ferrooxydans]|uniref:Ribonuclease M5 n=1 Tax=Fodinisporobacter ferrooxydans TaxID=2901836 RepID=A0ABY4CMT2_9BACL|nr:ribonuclease M5 [Alicyclobacillaceae bacterium MYW30-H2]
MIREVIVVEGLHDKQAIDRAVHADVLISNGSAVSESFLKLVERAQQQRGVIILTDPDYAGERIRRIVSRRVPGCKHAFLPREQAIKNGDLGVENASPAAIQRALQEVRSEWEGGREEFTWDEMVEYGLNGQSYSGQLRKMLGERLGIGYGNAKSFWKKLNMLGVGREEFETALADCLKQLA